MLVYKEVSPQGYAEYLLNNKYHHSDKGCECKTYRDKNKGCYGVVKKCLTHNVICSKTGWELGWYLGTDSRKIVCEICGEPITLPRIRLCEKCAIINTAKNHKMYQLKRKLFRQHIREIKCQK